ncbi:MAG: hypothetical protein R3220_12530 [Balneolaceae bacterium]|nr:hypothetical protein [Balneolaceae bacterium]
MKITTIGWLFFLFLLIASLPSAIAQDGNTDLFTGKEIFEVTLEGNLRKLKRDRGSDPPYREMKIHYRNENSEIETQELRVKTRGKFRRLNCADPPLWFNFKKHELPDNSPFIGYPKMKVVVPCQGEKYVLREYLVYKMYNLLTDHSFRVRLIHLKYHDTRRDRLSGPEYAFLIEDEDEVAARSKAGLYKRNHLRPEVIEQEAFFRMSVFAYMIGHTDWSIQYQHNLKILFLNDEKEYIAVPYDFDLVGLVSSPYAEPAPQLKLKSVRERVFRGYCLDDLDKLKPTFQQFRRLKSEIYSVLTQNTLLDNDYKNWAIEYLDEFYETIDDPKKRSKVFSYPCDENGTGNVVISGIRN